MRVKDLCPCCSTVLESTAPDLTESPSELEYAELGRSVINDRLLHVIMECDEVENC